MATEHGVADLAAEAQLGDPAFYVRADRFSTYARLRREAPVFWCEPAGAWVLTKHADILSLEKDKPPITARQGFFMLEAKRQDLIDVRDPGGASQAGLAFLNDPPEHTKFRRLVTGAFTPRRLSELEPMIQSLADELLDQLPENEPVDFADALSAPLAIGVIAAFLGIPRETWRDIARWTHSQSDLLGGSIAEGSPEAQQATDAMTQMFGYLTEQLADRARAPREDFMTTVATSELDGKPLPDMSQLIAAYGVLTAGNDTIANLLSGAMVAFAEYPDQWEALVANPALIPSAIEELLRWVCPQISTGRRATEPFVFRDQQIAAGDFLTRLFEAANRDEDVWQDADKFDVSRGVRSPHLGFGWGVHLCVGNPLARAEARVVLDGLIKRFRSWELAGPPVCTPSSAVRTYKQVQIVLKRR